MIFIIGLAVWGLGRAYSDYAPLYSTRESLAFIVSDCGFVTAVVGLIKILYGCFA